MKKLLFILTVCFLVIACEDSVKPAKEVSIEPTEEIINKYKGKDFSIVLDDMKIEEETYFTVYQQKYKVLSLEKDSLHVKKTPWETVSQEYFTKHENDLGMEVISNHNNKLTRTAKPVGFGWAVGNEKHGEWEAVQNDSTNNYTNNNRRWRTNNSSFFFWYWITSRRSTYRSDYRGYQTSSARGAAYYGNKTNSGNYTYGTRSAHQKSTRTSFFKRKTSNATRWSNHKTTRGSSRYSSGSTTRSRSGGFGK